MLKMKLIASLLLIVLTTAMIGGLTGAWFTDADNAGTATFTAGTLDVDVSDGLTELTVLDTAKLAAMEPGDVFGPVTINIKNMGNKNLAWFGNWTFTPQTEGADKLLDKIYIKTMSMSFLNSDGLPWNDNEWYQGHNFIENGRGNDLGFNYGEAKAFNDIANADPDADEHFPGVITLRNFNDNTTMVSTSIYEHMGALKPGYKYVLKVEFGFHESANFEYMGNAPGVSPIIIGFNVEATQVNEAAINNMIAGKGTSAHMVFMTSQLKPEIQP